LGGGYGNQVLSFALELRRTIVNHFKIHIRGHEAAALASTLIMGYRADLSPEILSAYSKTGTMHVLSVSGMHVALLFVMFAFLLKPLERIQKLRVLQLFILITLVWFYALLTGFSPSVNRAALMLSFVVLGKAVYKSMNTYNLLAISAFILLLYNPLYLFDIGFQLSYLAVFGLILIHPMIYQSFYIKNKLLDAIWSYTALSIAAQTITAPLSMYIFHQFPLYFLMSNLIIVLPVSLIMYLGVGFVLLLPFGLFLPFTGEVLHHLIQSTNSMLLYVEHLPFSSMDGIWINSFQLILIYLIVFAVSFTLIYKSKKLLFTTLIATVLLLLSTNLRQVEIKRKQEIIFFSLRKNTAIAYISGKEVFLVTDLEKEDKAYQFSIYPALSQSGLKIKAWLNPGADYYSSDFCQQNNRMQFAALKVFRWSPALNYKLFDRIIETDIILLSGNPVIRLKDLVQKANFSQLLIDGTNPDYKIKKWMEEARTLAIPLHVLKKNKAWIQEISVNKPQ
jgi:competence protein ComEC